MSAAYVDTSFLVAIALDERNATELARRLTTFERVSASPLLDAELRSTLRRESRPVDDALTQRVMWIVPDRSLSVEIDQVLNAGDVRGADCLHLASALYYCAEPSALTFLTLDSRQRAVAKSLGFKT